MGRPCRPLDEFWILRLRTDDSQSNSDDRPGRSDDEAGNVVPHAVAKSTDGTLDESATCPHIDEQPDRTRQPA